MRKTLLVIFTISFVCPLFAQNNSSNPQYWKNRIPFVGYWQQDVHYRIKAKIDEKTDQIQCNDYRLTYTNNSPDTLTELYFHLFSNAFQPNSYYHQLWQGNDKEPKFGQKYEINGKGNEISNLKVNDKEVKVQLDNTILKVILNEPLLPNSKLDVSMNFITYYDKGDMRRRMKMFDAFGNKHFDGVHWYPSIAVYDRKFGWTTDQHLDKEFYHDYGTFEVELTFPQHYIVEATGTLQNRDVVLPKELRKKLNLRNFKDKPFNSAPSEIIPKDSTKFKTWKYLSHNTHNFVFTADPSYRIGEVEWNGVRCISLVQEPHAAKWQKSAQFLSEVIQTYSEDFGMYCWPKVIIADARDGMEYSMITLDGGTFPGHKGLIAHEVGHMWYYGQVGTNETYRANMDEGFTQFLTAWFMDKHMEPIATDPKKYHQSGAPHNRFFSLYYSYLSAVWSGYDHQLNTHAAAYNGGLRHGGGYGLVYSKQGTMLCNLQYVLGDELFGKAMKNYFNQWKFAHPYPADFRNSIIQYTKADLNWFFDQWFETTKFIDYGIKKVEKTKDGDSNSHTHEITFERKGRMQMPIDFVVINDKGDTSKYHIPNTWFVKKTDGEVLPKWYGWDLLQEEYIADITIDGEIENVIIDPAHLMTDIDLRDNAQKGTKVLKFDKRKPEFAPWDKEILKLGPAFSYDKLEGAKIGVKYSKNYFGKDDFVDFNVYFNTQQLQNLGTDVTVPAKGLPISFSYNIRKNFNKRWRGLSFTENAAFTDGVARFKIGLSKKFQKQDRRNPNYSRISIFSKHLVNSTNIDHDYYYLQQSHWSSGTKDPNQRGWAPDRVNASLNISFQRHYTYKKGNGDVTFMLRTPGIAGDYNYSYLEMNSINNIRFGKLDLKSRVFGRWGTSGAPLESALYLAGANQEKMIDSKYIEVADMLPNGALNSNSWFNYGSGLNHFQQGGGLNIRGYAGYLAPETAFGNTELAYLGKSGASWNLELDFDRLIKFKKRNKYVHLDTYVFSDIGMIVYETSTGATATGSLSADAGIGSALTIKFPGTTIRPLTLRFDMPLLINRIPFDDFDASQSILQNSLGFRYVVGVGRSF